jgi:hypothetical protein
MLHIYVWSPSNKEKIGLESGGYLTNAFNAEPGGSRPGG